MSDVLVRALSVDARLLFVDATVTVSAMVEAHALGPAAARLAAQLAVANLLMSAWVKGDERVTLQLQAEAPRCSFMGEADAMGAFRGAFRPATLPTGDTVRGLLLAIKADGGEEMYRGVTEVDGHPLDVALERHLAQSDQVDVVVRIDVGPGRALGVLVERLPVLGDVDEARAAFREAFAPLRTAPLAGLGEDLAHDQLGEEPVQVVERRSLAWRCRCSRERVTTMLYALGADTLREMIAQDGGAEVRCHYCEAVYRLDADELAAAPCLQEPQA